MTIKNALLRLAAASATTALVTVGAMGPVHASEGKSAGGKGADNAAARSAAGSEDRSKAGAKGSARSAGQGAAKTAEKQDRPEKAGSTDKPAHRSAEVGAGPQPESNADNRNPKGQEAGPSDRNNGYECNQGIAQGNPAHTTCTDGQVQEGQVEEGDEDETAGEGGNGEGHTPVTVCHPLPNGKYLILTFDDDALDAHIGHGDLLLEDAAACPESVPDGGVTPSADAGTDTELTTDAEPTPETEGEAAVVPAPASGTEVLGVEKTIENVGVELYRDVKLTAHAANDDVVAGVEAEAAPAAGFLPNTGAGQYGAVLLAGVALLAAGMTLIARRRPLGNR